MQNEIKFEDLSNADLILDCVYLGGVEHNRGAGNDPINKLLGCGNQGGFRYLGSLHTGNIKYVVLISSLSEPDWPDSIDENSGRFNYFGDNRNPGYALEDTSRKGNLILTQIFSNLYERNRDLIPPIFIFTKTGSKRDYEFRGLAVPGAMGLSQTEDLVAVWRSKNGKRFQNYKATFTILDIPKICRSWISDLKNNNPLSENCPIIWRKWVNGGIYTNLNAPRTITERSRSEQLPHEKGGIEIIETIYNYFKVNPYAFERCAAELIKLMDRNVVSYDLTRPWKDGGRDALGKYGIGLEGSNAINVEFAMEAKLYDFKNSVGIRETSRLLSRLRFRQFGILVTTSYISSQAYQEIIEDQHPVIFICAKDIVTILQRNGYGTNEEVNNWLVVNFPDP